MRKYFIWVLLVISCYCNFSCQPQSSEKTIAKNFNWRALPDLPQAVGGPIAGVSNGAMVVADFLLSPEAQARKADPQFWGEPTVLDMALLNKTDRALFESVDLGVWALPIGTGKVLPEPHSSWALALEAAWLERYGQ